MSIHSCIQVEKQGRIALVWLNRPEAKNRFHREMVESLQSVMDEAEKDPEISVVVIAAKGEVFCAGGDMGDYTSMSVGEIRGFWQEFIRLYVTIANLSKPTIAAVDGLVEGGGFTLFDACDMAVATSRAAFSAPEAKTGLGPIVVSVAMGRSLGRRKAMELFCTGASLGAEEALRLGLINKLVPEGAAVKEALALAKSMVANNPSAIGLCKRLYQSCFAHDYADQLQRALDVLISMLKSEDGLESAKSRRENRQPKWTGR